MNRLLVKHLGPIAEADIQFGDLTFFVGQQATGKSILLQLLKLIVDKKHIRRTLEQFGFTWPGNADAILNQFFGEGMAGIWSSGTDIKLDNVPFQKSSLLAKKGERYRDAEEKMFYIPAQRVICLQAGWPRYFREYDDAAPYILRHFSETLRQLLEYGLDEKKASLFPQDQRLKAPLRRAFNESIFHEGSIYIDRSGNKKQLRLQVGEAQLPFITWSAGQKEFMPLLLSFYWLCPPSKVSKKDDINYVVLEEPEMGLHPAAIQAVLLQVLDLLSRGYKVIISTHSPVMLQFSWAFRILQEDGAPDSSLYELFGLAKSAPVQRLFDGLLSKTNIRTHYFDQEAGQTRILDISSLDAGSTDERVADWGGISSFSTKATDVILSQRGHG